MASPLQAQMMANQVAQAQQARQALRANPVGGVQAAAPANANALMAMRNQQVPNIQKTQGPASRLQEVDKIKYQEALKQQQFKEDALRRRDNLLNRQNIALNAQKQENAMQELAQRHNNALETVRVGQENAKDLERFKLKMAEDTKRMNYKLADEKYGPLRNYVSTIFSKTDNWLTTGKAEFETTRREQLQLDTAKIAGITPEMVQARYNEDVKGGIVAQTTLNPGSALYNKYARKILMSGAYDTQIAQINTQVQQESNQRTQQMFAMYKVASDKVMKLGFTVPGVSGLPSPDTSGPRPKVDANSLPNTSNLDPSANTFTDEQKAEYLKKFPDSDADGDGILTQKEMEAFGTPLGAKDVGVILPVANYALETVEGMAKAIAENPDVAAQVGVGLVGSAGVLDYLTSMGDGKRRALQLKLKKALQDKTRFSDKTKTKIVTEPPKKPLSKAELDKAKKDLDFLNSKGRTDLAKANPDIAREDAKKIKRLENKIADAQSTRVTVDTGEKKRLGFGARQAKQRAIAPKEMERLAKDMGLSKAELKKLDFKNMKVEDFSKMVAKQKGGVITSLKRAGLKILPTKNGGGIDIKKLTDNRATKGGLASLGIMGIIDLISWANLPDQTEAKKAKRMLEAYEEANKLLLEGVDSEIAELEADLEQEDNSSTPLVPNVVNTGSPTVGNIMPGLNGLNASQMQILTDKMNSDPRFAPIPETIR